MSNGEAAAYLPGDPRFGLNADELKEYYGTKPAQWAIYCWDKPDTLEARGIHVTPGSRTLRSKTP